MKKYNIILLLLSVVSIILAIVLFNKSASSLDDLNNTMSVFNKYNTNNTKSYLYIKNAYINNNNYYIVYLDEGVYVLKSDIKLEDYSFDGKYQRVVGESKQFDNNDISRITDIYNNYYSYSESSKIKEDEFNDYFGSYYLEVDEVINDLDVGKIIGNFAELFLEIGIILFVIVLLNLIIYIKKRIY